MLMYMLTYTHKELRKCVSVGLINLDFNHHIGLHVRLKQYIVTYASAYSTYEF